MLQKPLIVAAASCLLATAAHANLVTFTGNTSGGSTYNRAVEDGSSASSAGTAVHYNAYSFSVATAGTYNVTITGGYDTFAFLYSPTFAAGAALSNYKVGNDDLITPPFTTSGFSTSLAANTNYTLVTTGFLNTDAGLFSATIGGAGTIAPAATTVSIPTPGIFTRVVDTTGDPTFNRPVEDLSTLSTIGTATPYDVFRFTVSATGLYSFATNGLFDTFDFLYAGAFDPTKPRTGVQADNDDLLGTGTSGFASSLTAGVDYFLLTTGFGNGDFGLVSTTIGGPGAVSAFVQGSVVPEPDLIALMLTGFGLVGFTTRRRKG